MRVHKINNVNKALDFIASKGVKLVSIGAEGESGPLVGLGGPIQATAGSGKTCQLAPAPAPPCHHDAQSLPTAPQRDTASWCGDPMLAPERSAGNACLRFA